MESFKDLEKPNTNLLETVADLKIETLRDVTEEVERIAALCIQRLGGRTDGARPVVVTIQSGGQQKKAKCYGHISPERWQKFGRSAKTGLALKPKAADTLHEMNISAEWLNRSGLDIVLTIAHEAVHLRNLDCNVQDCAKGGRHNKKFKSLAESTGLVIELDGGRGWSATSATPEFREWVEEFVKPNMTIFNRCRKLEGRETKSASMVKWECGCMKVYASRKAPFSAECDRCGKRFTNGEVEEGDEEQAL